MSRLTNGSSLIGTLVAFFVLVGVAVYYFTGGFGGKDPENVRPDGKGQTIIGSSRYAAEDSVCRTQLGQVRQLIMIDTTVDDTYPATLESVSGMPPDYATCSIDDEPYDYDPMTGTVSCPHAGHENY